MPFTLILILSLKGEEDKDRISMISDYHQKRRTPHALYCGAAEDGAGRLH